MIMKPHIIVNLKYFIIYLMTDIPCFIYILLHEMRGGIVVRQRLRCLNQNNILEQAIMDEKVNS